MAKKKRKKTPEELEELRRWEEQADENLRRLREHVARRWAEIEARRAREAQPG